MRRSTAAGLSERGHVLAAAPEARMVFHGQRGQQAVVLVDGWLRPPVFEWVPAGTDEANAACAAPPLRPRQGCFRGANFEQSSESLSIYLSEKENSC